MPSGRSSIHCGGIPLKDGVFAVVEIASLVDYGVASDLMTEVVKEIELSESGKVTKRAFYLADTEAFMDPCCAVPDLGGPKNQYFVVKPRNQWAKEFIRWIKDEHRLDHMDIIQKIEVEEASSSGSIAEDRPKRKKKMVQKYQWISTDP